MAVHQEIAARTRKRWSSRLRTAGALLLLGGTVALADRLLPRAPDPVWGAERSATLWVAGGILVVVGAFLFRLGHRWH